MKKLIVVLSFFLAVCLGFSAFAEELPNEPVLTGKLPADESLPENTSLPLSSEETSPKPSPDGTEPTEGSPQTVSEWLLEKIYRFRNEILDAVIMALWGIVMFLVKKRLLPAQRSFIDSTTSNLNRFADDLSGSQEEIRKSVEEIGNTVLQTADTTKKTIERVESLQAQQAITGQDREVLIRVLTAQEEMLNTIIQASTLAQWRKDQIGKQHEDNLTEIREMKKTSALSGLEGVTPDV